MQNLTQPAPEPGTPAWDRLAASEAANPWMIHPRIQWVRAWDARHGDQSDRPGWMTSSSYN